MNTQKDFTFSKNERLCHKVSIDELFKKGENVFLYPFKLIFKRKVEISDLPTQVLFSVSKRSFKRAIDRNWIKRRLREIYRLHKHLFQTKEGLAYLEHLAVVYVAKERIDYKELKRKFIHVTKKIALPALDA